MGPLTKPLTGTLIDFPKDLIIIQEIVKLDIIKYHKNKPKKHKYNHWHNKSQW